VQHQDLAVAEPARADPHGRDVDRLSQRAAERLRHALHDQQEGTGLLERPRILRDARRFIGALTLDPVTTHQVDGLWGEADVAHHGDLRFDQGPYEGRPFAPSLQLDGGRAGLLQETAGVADGVPAPRLIRQVGHVGDHHGPPGRASHGPRVVQHLLHGDRQRARIPENVVGDTVSHQEDIDPGGIQKPSRRVVVRRQHGDLPTAPFGGAQLGDGDGTNRRGG
jgi:hypothetical protein